MSLSPQILQQVQDSVVPSPILVVPFKPLVIDTNINSQKVTDSTKKETQKIKNTAVKNNIEKLPNNQATALEIKKDSATITTKTDTVINYVDIATDTSTSIILESVSENSQNLIDKEIVPINYRSSIFIEHELKSPYIEPKERVQTSSNWMLGIIVLIILLLLLNKLLTPKKWAQQLKIIFSKRDFEQQIRDEKDFRSPFLFIQFIASLLTFTLFIYQLFHNKFSYFEESEYQLFFKILVSLLGLLLIYFISQKIAGFIVDKGRVVSEYLISTLLLFNITGIFLLPLSLGLQYSHAIPANILFNTGITILGFSYLFKLYKGLTIASSYNSLHLFYLFLYICTLEILPIAIAVKFLSENL
jgi:hypothetical protein